MTLLSFLFVIAALIALAAAPAVLLERVSNSFRVLSEDVLPVYDGLREVALSMEQQSAAVRGHLISGDPVYREQIDAARATELRALQRLDRLVDGISPAAVRHLAAMELASARRHALHRELVNAPDGPAAYRAAAGNIERLRDSTLLHLAALEEELLEVTTARMRGEARWAGLQRTLSFGLGAVAVLAALLVAWFARRQQLLNDRIEAALVEANHSREEAEQRREEVERVTESRARLIRGFSHDVKNPLGAASGYLELLQEGLMDPLTEKQRRGVERVRLSIHAALNLVEDLLELARAETGGVEVSLVPTDVLEVVRDAAEEYRAQAEAKGLLLELCLPPAAPPARTDGRRVRQVLGNLLSNAVKYTPAGRVEIGVELAGDREGGGAERLAIRVTDTGPGIAPEQRHLLFEEFVRLDPASGRGAGVGLTISRRIAEALGGEITVDSEQGRGSTFTLWLPLGGPAPAAPPGPEAGPRTAEDA